MHETLAVGVENHQRSHAFALATKIRVINPSAKPNLRGHAGVIADRVVEEVEFGAVVALLHVLEDGQAPFAELMVGRVRVLAPGHGDVLAVHLHICLMLLKT